MKNNNDCLLRIKITKKNFKIQKQIRRGKKSKVKITSCQKFSYEKNTKKMAKKKVWIIKYQ